MEIHLQHYYILIDIIHICEGSFEMHQDVNIRGVIGSFEEFKSEP